MELSQKELQRVKVIENAVQGRITVAEASGLLHLTTRQVKRLKGRYEPDRVEWGAAWLLEVEKISVSREAVRRLLRRAKLKSPQRRRDQVGWSGDTGAG